MVLPFLILTDDLVQKPDLVYTLVKRIKEKNYIHDKNFKMIYTVKMDGGRLSWYEQE